jgi:hypothetical protein
MEVLERVQRTYPFAEKVTIKEAFKQRGGWEEVPNAELSLDRLKDLRFFGYKGVCLEIVDDEGYTVAPFSDYALSEFGL